MPTLPWIQRKHRTSDAPFPADYPDLPPRGPSSRRPSEYEMESSRPGAISLGEVQDDENGGFSVLHHRRHDSSLTDNSFASSMGDSSIKKGKSRALDYGDVLIEGDESDDRQSEAANEQRPDVPAPRRKPLRSRFGRGNRARSRSDLPLKPKRTMWERFKRGLLGENKTTSQAVMPDGSPLNLKSLFVQDAKALVKLTKTMDYKVLARRSLDRQWWKWYIIIGIIIILSALVTVKHDAIIEWIKPGAQKLKEWPAGWMIPLAILIVLSFPPLVGHEVISIVIGIVWGLGVGFAILAAGTFLGELATWFAFKGMCTGRAGKFQAQNKYYSALVQLIREKSFLFVLVLRFSAIPGHITTALSASAGAHFFSYCMAAILTLPKQLSLVYVGTAFGSKNSTTHTVSAITLLLTIIGTGIAAIYIYYQMRIYLICAGCESPSDTLVRDSAMTQMPTTNTLYDLEDKLNASEYPPPYRARSGTILSGEAAPAYATIQMQKHERRPFIHSNSSYYGNPSRPVEAHGSGSGTPSRSRSLGLTAQDDLAAYLAQKRRGSRLASVSRRESVDQEPYRDDADQGPTFVIDSVEDDGRTRSRAPKTQSVEDFRPPAHTYRNVPDNVVAVPQGFLDSARVSSRSRSVTNASIVSDASHLSEQSLLDPEQRIPKASSEEEDYVRGTSSMDMWRPSSMTLSAVGKQAQVRYEERRQQERAQRLGGREIAQDADEYALQNGAKRPDINRRRGESSAALLGHPGDME